MRRRTLSRSTHVPGRLAALAVQVCRLGCLELGCDEAGVVGGSLQQGPAVPSCTSLGRRHGVSDTVTGSMAFAGPRLSHRPWK